MTQTQSSQIKVLNEYISALQKQIKSFDTQRQSLRHQLQNAQTHIDKIDNENKNIKKQFKQLNNNLFKISIEKTNAENRLAFFIQENTKLKNQIQYKQDKIQQLNAIVREKSQTLAKQKNSTYQTLTLHNSQLKELQDKTKELQDKTKELQDKNKELLTKLQKAMEQKMLMQVEVDYWNAELKREEQNNKLLTQENSKLKETLSLLQKALQFEKGQLQIALNQINRLKEQGQRIRVEKERVKQEGERMREEIKIQLVSIQGLNQSLRLQTGNFQKEFNTNKALNEQIKRLNDKVEELQKQISQGQKQSGELLVQKSAELTQLNTKYQEIKKSLQQKCKLIDKLQQRIQIKQDQNKNSQQSLLNIRQQLESQTNRWLKVNKINEQKIQTLEKLNHLLAQKQKENTIKYQQISTNYQHQQDNCSKLKQQIDQIQRQHQKQILAFRNDHNEQVRTLKKQLQAKESKIRELSENNIFSSKQRMFKQQQVTRRYSELQSRHNKTAAKLEALQHQFQRKDQEHNSAINKMLLQHRQQMKGIFSKHDEEVVRIKQKLMQSESVNRETIVKKQEQIAELQVEIKQLQTVINKEDVSAKSKNKYEIETLKEELRQAKLTIQQMQESLALRESKIVSLNQIITTKDLKLQILNAQTEKYKKDTLWLIDENKILKQQVEALQNSTAYLKKQISSVLDKQQSSMREIQLLKSSHRLSSTKLIGVNEREMVNGHDSSFRGSGVNMNRHNGRRNVSFFNPYRSNQSSNQGSKTNIVHQFSNNGGEGNMQQNNSKNIKQSNFINQNNKNSNMQSLEIRRVEEYTEICQQQSESTHSKGNNRKQVDCETHKMCEQGRNEADVRQHLDQTDSTFDEKNTQTTIN